MIWIIGGTSEAGELVRRIKGRKDFIITSATEEEKEFIDCKELRVGRMDYNNMIKFVRENNINLIIDLSHPYAKIVSKNAKKVSKLENIKYIRYVREKTHIPSEVVYNKSFNDTLDYLKNVKGIVFFTTGSKNIGDFETIKGSNRFIYRILPTPSSINECKKYNVKVKDIVAVLGPFSKEFNYLMFKEYNVNYVVMKDSGKEGGTIEKINACIELGIVPVMIGRELDSGIYDLDEIIRQI